MCNPSSTLRLRCYLCLAHGCSRIFQKLQVDSNSAVMVVNHSKTGGTGCGLTSCGSFDTVTLQPRETDREREPIL